jgi:hypothetical protein
MSDESELDTEPAVAIPSDQDSHVRAAAYGRALLAYHELGKHIGFSLKDYVEGSLRGQVAEAANIAGTLISVAMRAKQDAFEAHIRDELKAIREQNDTILKLVQSLTDERLEDHQKLVSLTKWRELHEHGNEHCKSCPCHDETESQIGVAGGG